MKKTALALCLVVVSQMFAKPVIIVSILPQKTFVEKIAKDLVAVTVMVEPGSSPHAYEPKSSQMVALSKADVYFSIGVEFENAWLSKFKSQNPRLEFVNLSDTLAKLPMRGHHHEEDGGAHHEGLDPHTWTSPKNVAVMAHIICQTLQKLDPKNRQSYEANLKDFLKEIENTDTTIKNTLKSVPPKSKFMVFHPSWGYFANAYNLEQFAVEVEGKNPRPKEMILILKEAKEEHIKVIFTQPEFSDKSAAILAKEANARVQKISPLDANWSQNLINMAKAIAGK